MSTSRTTSSGSPLTGQSTNTRAGRELFPSRNHSRTLMELPEQLKGEEEDGSDDGITAGDEEQGIFAQQSVYGMLAATTSRANFMFEQGSGSESEGEDIAGLKKDIPTGGAKDGKKSNPRSSGPTSQVKPDPPATRHRQRLSETKLAQSVLKPARKRKDSQANDPMTQSQFLPPRKGGEEEEEEEPAQKLEALRKEAPMLDLKMQAMARAGFNSSSTSLSGKQSGEMKQHYKPHKSLPKVIAGIFHFPEPEEIIAELPCWYLQNVLLQGFMYITQKHVCFYAYLAKKTNVTIKTGQLGRQGKHRYGFSYYWFVLKGDIFCYYKNPAEPYFPLGVVDLRYAISADVSDKESTEFIITTHDRTHNYKAETPGAAKEWVKQLQRVIFRSRNDGDAVKISLLTENILDIEKAEVVDFAETVKLRVVGKEEESYAIDEYFFTFFSHGDDAWDVLKVLTDGNESAKQAVAMESEEEGQHRGKSQSSKSRSKQANGGQLLNVDKGQGSPSRRSHSRSSLSASIQESSESYLTSGDEVDANMSASQMLSDDGLFGGPTLRSPQRQRPVSGPSKDRIRRGTSQPSSSRDSSIERDDLPTQHPTRQGHHARRPDLEPRSSAGSGSTLDAENSRGTPTDTTASGRVIRGISAPLQQAVAVAGMVRASSQRMGSYLGSSPKDYIGRWSGAITGGKKHYSDVEGLAPDDSVRDLEQAGDVENDQLRFQTHFGLPHTEELKSTFFCWLHKTVPLYGKVYMSQRRFCFRSLWYGTKIKLVISFKDIVTVHKQRGFRWGYSGMVLVIKGHEELFLEFGNAGLRDDCAITVLRSLENGSHALESTILDEEELQLAETAAAENELLQAARKDSYAKYETQVPRSVQQTENDGPPILFDDNGASVVEFKPKSPMNITCLTIGSRGDVQPYIALCKGFIAEGHCAKIATHKEFGPWVEKHGIEFAEVEGDPADLMRICVENGMFTPSFFLEANSKFRSWLDGLLVSSYEACKGADLIIESPSAMSGIHIAEKLQVPYFRAFTMPWTRTRAYPHAFSVPNSKKGGAYNYMTYTLFDNVFWIAISGQINRWRAKTLGLMPTSLDRLQQNKVPFLYNFSPNVVVPPLDFSDWIKVTGYWFLDEGEAYTPPADLEAFIQKARDDNVKLVYIGFGSVTVADSQQLMQQVMDAVQKADVRCILSKGWSDRFDAKPTSSASPAAELPSYIHQIRSAPHDWLFAQVDAVVHHGGAGTTGASLRAGVPTIIKPFFGDQFFFATRVEDLGVGVQLEGKISSLKLGKALWIATHDARMQKKAKELGELIRGEDGVGNAIREVWRGLEYARGLVEMRCRGEGGEGQESVGTEENWTFVEIEGEEGEEREDGGDVVDPAPITTGVAV